MSLTSRQREAFATDGFLILPSLFSGDELRGIRRAFSRLQALANRLRTTTDFRGSRFVLDPEGDQVKIHRVVWCGGAERLLDQVGADERLLLPVADLLDSDTLVQLINQAHFKLPGDGVAFGWHQDSVHRRYGSPEWSDVNGAGSYVQSALAVDDVTADNGPLKFIPGSGQWGHLAPGPDGSLPADVAALGRPVAPEMAAGSVILFGPYTFHSSEPNRSDAPRRVLINGYALPGANRRVYPGCGTGKIRRLAKRSRKSA